MAHPTDSQNQPASITVAADGYVYADGVKICRLDPAGPTLYFFDKDRRRADQRGNREVAVPLADLTALAPGL